MTNPRTTLPILESANLVAAEIALITYAMRRHPILHGAATELGITRHALRRRLAAHNLNHLRKQMGADSAYYHDNER